MKILRWDVPVDDQDHEITCGNVLAVDCRDPRTVTFWAEDALPIPRTFRVFATGQEMVGSDWNYLGTALSPALPPFANRGDLVWHLVERYTP